MGLFERYLSVWVGLSIIAGIGLGLAIPGVFELIATLEYAHVNLIIFFTNRLVRAMLWVQIPAASP